MGIGIQYPKHTLHIHSLKKKSGVTTMDYMLNFLSEGNTNGNHENINFHDYYTASLQLTNKATDSTADDGFVLDLRNKSIHFNLQEAGQMSFTTNDETVFTILPTHNAYIGHRQNVDEAKFSIMNRRFQGGLQIYSRYSTKEGDGYLIKAFSHDAYNAFIVRNNGNVGIGTFNPKEKLAVNGTILAKEIKVVADINNYPDFVFENDYSLMSIRDLENYISKNKHLPDIPSLKDVSKDDINLGEMNVLLLKKVEELTLYIIELQKQIDELKK